MMWHSEQTPDIVREHGFHRREIDQTGESAVGEPTVGAASSKIPVSTIKADNIRLRAKRPFSVLLTVTDRFFLLESEALSIYAAGETYADAIQDFCEQTVDVFQHYKDISEHDVIGEAQRLKRLYAELFIEENNAP